MSLQLSTIEETPLVSILISSYNHDKYIEDAVHSSLHQSYLNMEVIVCDDGSKDDSVAILHSLEKSNPKKLSVLTKENGGQASAINAAYQKSSGDIVCFLDSDDYFYEEKIQLVVNHFQKNPQIGFFVHRLDKVNEKDKKLGQLPLSSRLPSGCYADFVISTGSTPNGFPVTSALALRRDVAEQIFPINENVIYDLDEIIRRLALLITNVGHIDQSLGAYRIHGKNVTAMDVRSRLKLMQPIYETIYKETKKFIEAKHPDKADEYPNLDEDLHYLLMNYVLRRLNQKTDNTFWSEIKRNRSFNSWSKARKAFWMVAIYSPDFIFKRMIALYWGPNGLKLKFSKIQSQFRYLFSNNHK